MRRGVSVLGLWCSKNKTARLEGKDFYNLAFLEVHPAWKRQFFGSFMVGLVASRAAEVGSGGIVLATDTATSNFYGKIGGVPRTVKGLQTPRELVRIVFEGDAFAKLVEMTRDLLQSEKD